MCLSSPWTLLYPVLVPHKLAVLPQLNVRLRGLVTLSRKPRKAGIKHGWAAGGKSGIWNVSTVSGLSIDLSHLGSQPD